MAQNLGGLSRGCNIYCRKPPKFVAISHRRIRSLVLYRIVAASGSLPQQNFDFGRRSYTPPFAQNDKQRFYFAIRVRKNGRFVNRPYELVYCVAGAMVISKFLLRTLLNKTNFLFAKSCACLDTYCGLCYNKRKKGGRV